MKIKVISKNPTVTLDDVLKMDKYHHKKPKKPAPIFRLLMKLLGAADLKETGFRAEMHGIDKIPDEPCLILMNHSSFIDLEIAADILFPKPFSIVCTSDGFVGKEWLMRNLGCIPTNKFVPDSSLISDIGYALRKNRTHVLMYPEASYSFDGKATPLPRKLGVILKLLNVPVIMIRTYGAFSRDPLYNMLQKRKVRVTADVSLLFSREDLKNKKISELDDDLDAAFSFDSFAWQKENDVKITEPFRADGLERILFRCPVCGKEGGLKGSGIRLSCSCGAGHTLSELGELIADEKRHVRFSHIPDWYGWERNEIRKEIEAGTFRIECDCRVLVLRNFKAVYDIGRGRLVHDNSGLTLTGPDGREYFKRPPQAGYSLYADYYWYELGDIICIGNNDILFYCIPDDACNVPVAKSRLAAEEMYSLFIKNRRGSAAEAMK